MKSTLRQWYDADGDNTLRVDYDLNENSLVWDVGGYKGEWAEKIWNRYHCFLDIFEPVEDYYKIIVNKFQYDKKILIWNCGLGTRDEVRNIAKNGDKSSFLTKTGEIKPAKLLDIGTMNEMVELIKLNIEGMEYELLNKIIHAGRITNYKNIQVQFHNFRDEHEDMRDEITEKLKQTHELQWQYDWVWESWKLK